MNKQELIKIKKKALEDNIPIIMDDTLQEVNNILKQIKPNRILEIGTATRLFSNLLFRILAIRRNN